MVCPILLVAVVVLVFSVPLPERQKGDIFYHKINANRFLRYHRKESKYVIVVKQFGETITGFNLSGS